MGKIRGQRDLRTINKGVNKIENQGNNWYKVFGNGQMTDFAENFYQHTVKLSLELNMIETNQFFLQKRGSQQ